MDCAHYTAGRCRSCSLIELPRPEQLSLKERQCRSLLDGPDLVWLPPVVGPEAGFRTKAKMVVSGSVDEPTLGILSTDGGGVDLRDCGLHTAGLRDALPRLARFVTLARIEPYDVARRRGELKHLLVTEAPDGSLMVRFVLRSTEALARIRKHLPTLLGDLPSVRVASVNLLPEHRAVLEGDEEIVLTDARTLTMDVNGIDLHLRPQGFFQTNTEVAAALYRQAAAWVDELFPVRPVIEPVEIWDLYCGVGGFALHLAAPGRSVTGIEVSEEASLAARQSAAELRRGEVTFHAGDATAYALSSSAPPDLAVVNPPRRGIGPELAGWLETSGVPHVVYSSCHAESLARDLAGMPSLVPRRAVLLDMFPQTRHYELLVLLSRA